MSMLKKLRSAWAKGRESSRQKAIDRAADKDWGGANDSSSYDEYDRTFPLNKADIPRGESFRRT